MRGVVKQCLAVFLDRPIDGHHGREHTFWVREN